MNKKQTCAQTENSKGQLCTKCHTLTGEQTRGESYFCVTGFVLFFFAVWCNCRLPTLNSRIQLCVDQYVSRRRPSGTVNISTLGDDILFCLLMFCHCCFQEDELLPMHSTTEGEVPCTEDGNYFYIPYRHNKPCLYVCSRFEDLRKRLYHTNLLDRIVEKLVRVTKG